MTSRWCLRAHFGVATRAPGVGKKLEKDLIEPGDIRASTGEPSAPFSISVATGAFLMISHHVDVSHELIWTVLSCTIQ